MFGRHRYATPRSYSPNASWRLASSPARELALALEPDELCGSDQFPSCSHTNLSVQIYRRVEL
eukprot:1651772-Pyramimonas_sp.AAC.1